MAVNQVLGFQFEPIKRRVSDKNNSDSSDDDDGGWETMSGSEDPDYEDVVKSRERRVLHTSEWCLCEMCVVMPQEEECVCCRELEVPQIVELAGR